MTNELEWSRRMTLILSCCILAAFILFWLITPAKSFVAGFILGEVIGLYNVLYLARRVRIVGERVAAGSPRIGGSGLLTRILMVALGIVLAYRFPGWIDYRSFVLGLPISYIVMLVAGWLNVKRMKKKQEGGDVLGNHSEY